MQIEPLLEDNYFHIYNRGNNKENIFIEEMNYTYFLSLLERHIIPISNILSYCLLKNHFHLLVKIKPDLTRKIISQKFSNLFNAYAKAINKRYGRTGSLFQDRFSRKKVADETYLRALIIYIHLNPSHHKFVNDFRTYKHSSYKSLISNNKSFLDRDFVINLFDDIKNFIYIHHSRLMQLNEEYTLE